jgi:hypothetical protein
MNLPPHPGFRDVLWDIVRTSPLADTLNIRVFSSDEELVDRDEVEEGLVWKVPSGLIPRTDPQRPSLVPLDAAMAMSIGQRLWASLPDQARARAIEPGPLPVRLKISGDVREVVYMPWECLPLPPGALIARSVPVAFPIPPLIVKPPLRVLFIITNPKDEYLLRSAQELGAIQMAQSPDYSSDVAWDATLAGVKGALDRMQPHIVHYVGHSGSSSGQGYLILHDVNEHTAWVGAEQMARLLPSSVRLLCLSTCFTGQNYDIRGLPLFAQAPADVTLPTSVVNRLPLDMSSEPVIRQFWSAFYTELRLGKGDVGSAFRDARNGIVTSRDCASFALVLRDGTGWGFAIDESAVETEEAKSAAFDAFYANTIGNYLTTQAAGSSSDVRRTLLERSRIEVQRAGDAMDLLQTFTWPRKD